MGVWTGETFAFICVLVACNRGSSSASLGLAVPGLVFSQPPAGYRLRSRPAPPVNIPSRSHSRFPCSGRRRKALMLASDFGGVDKQERKYCTSNGPALPRRHTAGHLPAEKLRLRNVENVPACAPVPRWTSERTRPAKVSNVACAGDLDLGLTWWLARIMQWERPDVVHCQSHRGGAFLVAWLRRWRACTLRSPARRW